MRAASSALTPYVAQPSSQTSARLVLRTEAATVSASSGRSERRSTTSASTPSRDRLSATRRARCTV